MYLNSEAAKAGLILARLTLTWDVFKYAVMISLFNFVWGLTLTWDVFKLIQK